jgi:hypothetical protein
MPMWWRRLLRITSSRRRVVPRLPAEKPDGTYRWISMRSRGRTMRLKTVRWSPGRAICLPSAVSLGSSKTTGPHFEDLVDTGEDEPKRSSGSRWPSNLSLNAPGPEGRRAYRVTRIGAVVDEGEEDNVDRWVRLGRPDDRDRGGGFAAWHAASSIGGARCGGTV